ncbi:hypothetical protein GCM10007418_15520 [Halopseudomonas salina]|uniref:Uncharacterized protein n=1 Tax=Halopseudomonas salina TaxID=1323744 RepID=A0ABQ1PHL5_9GAMM|nr:hypothetical protein GCM10007418_15520 [Halopseudomonas salina]
MRENDSQTHTNLPANVILANAGIHFRGVKKAGLSITTPDSSDVPAAKRSAIPAP